MSNGEPASPPAAPKHSRQAIRFALRAEAMRLLKGSGYPRWQRRLIAKQMTKDALRTGNYKVKDV